ncbi:MAG: transporter [Spirochaetes bacterium GWD1_61_31]|nr:MAG: transporter [Spirochaetes bacterium GWB1_60_80]OHD31327.1 MAG: transporter [Spirochaetes bacterium GWC1_61_12]OHD39512.1 MAG: transporter [Spirochaetes bacterium GWD1_61_31]OHD45566.1 MAG: transporter [Spirochaetes bacterium GWE1_60_18]OHD58139.1 MAG: transporter [Spirochaetes bacterium GWF1_60_12]
MPDGLPKKNFLPVLSGLFVGVLVISNILATKMVQLGPFVFDGGTLLFPLSYIFGDVLTEVYGYKDSRKVIWTGLLMLVLMSANTWLIGVLPAEPSWPFQADFDHLLLPLPRIALASIVAYFAGEYSNSVVLSRLKIRFKGRYLWVRTIGSTLVGQALDTLLFVLIAFYGLYPLPVLIAMVLSNYLFKTTIEAAFTPLTYLAVGAVKKAEHSDAYDYGEHYNPLPRG